MVKVSDMVRGRRVDPRGDLDYDTDEMHRYVGRFLSAFNADVDEDAKAKLVYEIHLEICSNYGLYIAVADDLGSTLKRALRTYVDKCRGNTAHSDADRFCPR